MTNDDHALTELIRVEEGKQAALDACKAACIAFERAKVQRARAAYDARQLGCSVFDIALEIGVSSTRAYQLIREYEAHPVTVQSELETALAEYKQALATGPSLLD